MPLCGDQIDFGDTELWRHCLFHEKNAQTDKYSGFFFFSPKRKYEICPQIEDMHMQVKDKKLHLYKCTYKRDH